MYLCNDIDVLTGYSHPLISLQAACTMTVDNS